MDISRNNLEDLSFPEAPPRFLGTCRHEGHMAIDFHKWKAEPSGMRSHAEHGNEERKSERQNVEQGTAE